MLQKFNAWFLGKISIRKKLVISFSLLVAIPIFIFGIYTAVSSNKNLLQQVDKTMSTNLTRAALDVKNRFQRENGFMKFQTYNSELRNVLELQSGDNTAIAKALNEDIEPTFWYFITSDESIKEIKIYSPYVYNEIGDFVVSSKPYENEPWYQWHMHNFKIRWQVEEGRLYASRTILNKEDSSHLIAVLKTEFYLDRFLEPLDSLNYLENGICVLDDTGQIIYSKKLGNKNIEKRVADKIQTIQPGEAYSDGQVILKSERIEETGWNIYYYIDKQVIYRQNSNVLFSTAIVGGLCTILVILLISMLSKMLSQRILKLKKYAKEISEGNLENSYYTEDTDEIGVVTNSLAKMTEQLNEMINRMYKVEMEKKEAELKALQAMINPHFLYNCLSSIKWKAIRKGDDEISEIVGLIAKFYRSALNNGKKITSVRNEIENIKAYVQIQQMTHDNGFDAEYDIAEEGMEYNMLNFLLQPIVENAVKHGIDYNEDDDIRGRIRIVFCQDEEFLKFYISNNGTAVDLNRKDEILNSAGMNGRYGIYNIRQRIEMYYGGEAGVFLNLTEEGETCFEVKIYKTIKQ